MALIATTTVSRDGVDIAGAAVAASDTFTNTGAEVILISNGSGGSINVTITTSATVDSQAVGDRVVAVGNTVTKAIGPFPRYVYGTTVTVTCSATSSVTMKVLKVTPELA
jgi:hypothetical protein